MRDFHNKRDWYYDMQYLTSRDHIMPYLKNYIELDSSKTILELGCGEGGVLEAFAEQGMKVTGVDFNEEKLSRAKRRQEKYVNSGSAAFHNANVLEKNTIELLGKFDVIILKDVIEHVPNQEIFIPQLTKYLKAHGVVFFGFPPWQMPFGGHQQILPNKIASRVPWMHILPVPIYSKILSWMDVPPANIQSMLEHKKTGISIEKFEKIVFDSDFFIRDRLLWLFNPIYSYKFSLPVIKQLPVLKSIPFVRNFYSTCAYYILEQTGGASRV